MKSCFNYECVSLEEYVRERTDMLYAALDSGIDYHKKSLNTYFNPKIAELNEKLNRVNWNTLEVLKR